MFATLLLLGVIAYALTQSKHPVLTHTYGPYLYNGVPSTDAVANSRSNIPPITDRHRLLLQNLGNVKSGASDKTVFSTLPNPRNPSKEYYPTLTDENLIFRYKPYRLQ